MKQRSAAVTQSIGKRLEIIQYFTDFYEAFILLTLISPRIIEMV